ncbi:hypothetical protein [Bradyrhizobium sp. LB12.1]|uniref:hypothetical protein n=1 Tax=Bradyrhizobium sp. LB12.1 TaxID=3156327 RepID=UPI0033938333
MFDDLIEEAARHGKKPSFDPSKPFTTTLGTQTYTSDKHVVEAAERNAITQGALIAIAPPLAALFLGMSLLWVARGFTAARTNTARP